MKLIAVMLYRNPLFKDVFCSVWRTHHNKTLSVEKKIHVFLKKWFYI